MSILPQKKVPELEMEELLEREIDGLYRAALRYTRHEAQAEDLVQDTVVRALRFRDKFTPGTHFRAWIYTILTNTFIHGYRRRRREREILGGVSRDDVQRELRSDAALARATHPENAYLENMLSDDVLRALDDIPEAFRIVVVLCDVEGLSYKDIAEAVGCPVGTVMSRLYRGRRLLESTLAGLAIERGIIKVNRPQAEDEHARDVVSIQAFRRTKTGE